MLELTFHHDGHVTKNTYRFQEIDTDTNKPEEKGDWVIGRLYISKGAFQGIRPDTITVKLEW